MTTKNKVLHILLFTSILFLGAFLRLYNLNWDQGFHLHPDERFLTMVGTAMKVPSSFFVYLNPTLSPMNPYNINFPFFVYGAFPLIVTKIVSVILNFDNYNDFTLVGRALSALSDIGTLIGVYFFTKEFSKKINFQPYIEYFALFFYAIAVLPIQLSHFFTVDQFLVFFMFFSSFFALKYSNSKNELYIWMSAVCTGLALACKLNAVAIIPLNILFIFISDDLFNKFNKRNIFSILKNNSYFTFLLVGLYLFISYVVLRFADPYMFTTNIFNLQLNTSFQKSIEQLSTYTSPNVWYPPNVQWFGKLPIIFSLYTMSFFGVGIIWFLIALVGIAIIIKKKDIILLSILLWVTLIFLYQSTQFAKTIRYFNYLYPFFAIFAGMGFSFLYKHTPKYISVVVVLLLLIWPTSFLSIYVHPHSRVVASNWINENLPSNSIILSEYWDDALPLSLAPEKNFTILQLPVFDLDTNTKWQKMDQMLNEGNYLILSSNRGWGSIMKVPQKYPKMSKFYQDLFAGKLPYKKIAEFTSYPSLSYIGIPIAFPDDNSEESFTVYDHPKVMIFKKYE